MLCVKKPSRETIRAFLDAQANLDFTYSAVGSTAHALPRDYVVNHTRVRLGEGDDLFERARRALTGWEQLHLGWVEASPHDTPIDAGAHIAIVAKGFGLWWLKACRIVYVVDESGPTKRFGFAYGTLPDHVGTGEERFLIELDPESQTVWYDILAFSRPHHRLARVGELFMRNAQKRFGRESANAMVRAVNGDLG